MLHRLETPATAAENWVVGVLRGHAQLTMTAPARMVDFTTPVLAPRKPEFHLPLEATAFREATVEVHATSQASETTTASVTWHELFKQDEVVHLLGVLRAAATRTPDALPLFHSKLPTCVDVATDASRRATTRRQLAETRAATTRVKATATSVDVKHLLAL
jgi:hypothetical protein